MEATGAGKQARVGIRLTFFALVAGVCNKKGQGSFTLPRLLKVEVIA